MRDGGPNGEVAATGTAFGSGESVKLYDAGDAIKINFSVPKTGMVRLAVRVRAGGGEARTSFWPDGYSFRLNGATLILVGDKTTLSALDPAHGGCYWGTMASGAFPLRNGTHTLEISATAAWAAVDYLEVSSGERSGSLRAAIASEGGPAEAALVSAAAPTKKPELIRVEPEADLMVEKDVGGNGAVAVADGGLDSGESIALYDVGDAVRVAFTVPLGGDYQVRVRVRAGGETGATVFWPDGYKVTLDGQNLDLEGDEKSLSEWDNAYGGCHWGTMQTNRVTLNEGRHVVVVSARTEWAVLDYVELAPDPK